MKAVELEYANAEDTMPRGVLGLNAPMFKGYLRFTTQPAARMKKTPSTKTSKILAEGAPSPASHNAQSVGHNSSKEPIGSSMRIRRQ